MMQALLDGQTACITVTLLDGIVLARSAFHHSVNYRSVAMFGKGIKIEGEKKLDALHAFMEHVVPGRHQHLRPDNSKELDATLVVKFEIEAASAKVRTGPPVDTAKDYELPIWAGVVNLKTVVESVTPCPQLIADVDLPEHVSVFIAAIND
jgi:nitroimidazol reductase NimA-like FMN-containing flavoprotein (pyridoxamine 5'-phosphate oxidase superfamily)